MKETFAINQIVRVSFVIMLRNLILMTLLSGEPFFVREKIQHIKFAKTKKIQKKKGKE